MREFEDIFEELTKDIVEKQDNARAMEFTKSIGTMLRENGVAPILTVHNASVDNGNSLGMTYGCFFDRLDFTEHDRVFKNEIEQLKQGIDKMESSKSDWIYKAVEWKHECEKLEKRIEELENQETTDLPFEPIKVANMLIDKFTNASEDYVKSTIKNGYPLDEVAFYDMRQQEVKMLHQIAEHLLIYCKHNKERDEECYTNFQ